MNGIATSLVVMRLRAQNDPFVEELVEEYEQIQRERDKARDLAATYLSQLFRLEEIRAAEKNGIPDNA